MIRTLTVLACLSLFGCANWETAPAEATGFLVVSHASLEGTIDGVPIDSSTRVRGTGYCTRSGWHLELRSRAGGQDVVNTLDVRDLAVADREVSLSFEPVTDVPNDLRVSGGVEPGRMSLESCTGDVSEPDFVGYASSIGLQLGTLDNGDVSVVYEANFDTGDTVRGQFDMEMPVVD